MASGCAASSPGARPGVPTDHCVPLRFTVSVDIERAGCQQQTHLRGDLNHRSASHQARSRSVQFGGTAVFQWMRILLPPADPNAITPRSAGPLLSPSARKVLGTCEDIRAPAKTNKPHRCWPGPLARGQNQPFLTAKPLSPIRGAGSLLADKVWSFLASAEGDMVAEHIGSYCNPRVSQPRTCRCRKRWALVFPAWNDVTAGAGSRPSVEDVGPAGYGGRAPCNVKFEWRWDYFTRNRASRGAGRGVAAGRRSSRRSTGCR